MLLMLALQVWHASCVEFVRFLWCVVYACQDLWTVKEGAMGRFSKVLLLGVVFALAFAVAQPAAAQVNSGSVSCTVVDQTGGSVPAASVTLTNRGTRAQT